MKKNLRFVLYILILFAVPATLSAQNRKLYNMHFEKISYDQFFRNLEIQTEYRFYYNEPELDSLFVTIDVTEKTLEEILNQVLANTSFHYTIDPRSNVFITRSNTILTTLPPGFFK